MREKCQASLASIIFKTFSSRGMEASPLISQSVDALPLKQQQPMLVVVNFLLNTDGVQISFEVYQNQNCMS